MSHEDFNVEGLAKYLHLRITQISRLADRGRLPGRKVGGQWRFSRAEIHHWLEDRIGLSDVGELAQVEGVLQASGSSASKSVLSIADMLPREAVALPLDARTRGSVISAMTKLAANTGLLWDVDKMTEAVRARENLHPTALDSGVALLHPRRPMTSILAEPFLALGRTPQGVPFGGRGGLTDVFFLICSSDDRGHLQVLARLSRLISDASLLKLIRDTDDVKTVHDAIQEVEQKLIS